MRDDGLLELAVKFEAIAEANAIYSAGAAATVRRMAVHAEPVATFAERLTRLEREVSYLREDDYWVTGLGYLRRRRFFIQATPMNAIDPALELLAYVSRARQHFSTCKSLYPEHADSAESACDALMEVFMSDVDPLSDAVAAELAESEADRFGVVLCTFGFEKCVQQHLRILTGNDKLDVVTPRDLATRRPYALLFVVGSAAWYVRRRWGWVFTAPRASELVILGYERQALSPLPPVKAFTRSQVAVEPVADRSPAFAEPDELGDESGVDWSFMSVEVERRVADSSPADLVDARLYLLASGYAAFLAASDESRIPTIEPDAPEGSRLVYVPAGEITPGSVVVLRSEGGGDLIVAVADALLGPGARPLRDMQEEWKSRLRSLVDQQGVASVVAALVGHGSTRANRSNLANWCSPRSLRTEDKHDFLAILRVLGLETEAEKYWKAMGRLVRAHRRAGHEIREQLEEQAENADLTLLEEKGRADFTLPQGGGALTAFRVEEISPDIVAVPYQHLGDPFEARA
jgi:hypothetical protein